MATTTNDYTTRSILQIVVQIIELIVVAAVGIPALLVERMEPGLVIIALSLLLLPTALRLLLTGRLAAPTLAIWPLLVLLGLCALTVRVTPAWQYTWPELVRLLWGVAVCLAVINWINPGPAGAAAHHARHSLTPRLQWATAAFFGLGGALTAVGLLVMGPTHKLALLDRWLAQLPQLPLAGFNGFNPNRVAGVAVLLAPLALALAIGPLLPKQRSFNVWLGWLLTKPLVIALALFFSSALLLTQSRAAWLALGCALLVILSLLGRRGWLLLAVGAVLATAAIMSVGPARLLQQVTVYDGAKIDPGALIQDRNLAGRLILWQRALHGLADAPLTGMGLGAFEAVSQLPYPQVAGYQPDPDMSHVHNIVLQVGLDFGLPGIIAFLALLAVSGQGLISLVRRAHAPSPLYTWSLGLLGSFVAYLVYSMLDAVTLGARPSVAVWFLFGLWLGAGEWAQSARQQAQGRRHARPVARPTVTVAAPPPTVAPPPVTAPPAARPTNAPGVAPTVVAAASAPPAATRPTGAPPATAPTSAESWEARAWAATAGSPPTPAEPVTKRG